MRVISGAYKGKKLLSPPPGVRPTTERMREALFNVLGTGVHGSTWLDLFAGSGAVGIEALSRGARLVYFNERDNRNARALERNLEHCSIREGYLVSRMDAFTFFNRSGSFEVNYIFLDPPYNFGRYGKLLERITGWLQAGAEVLVLLEVFKKTRVDFLPPGWRLERELKGGDSCVLFLSPPGARTFGT